MQEPGTSVLDIRVHGLKHPYRFECRNDEPNDPSGFLGDTFGLAASAPRVVSTPVRDRATRLLLTVLDALDRDPNPLRRVIRVSVQEGGRRLRWRWVHGGRHWKAAESLPSPRLAWAKLAVHALEQVLQSPNTFVRRLASDEVETLVALALQEIDKAFRDEPLERRRSWGDGHCRIEHYVRRLFRRHPLLHSLGRPELPVRGRRRLRVPVFYDGVAQLWQWARHADHLFVLERDTPLLFPVCLVVAEPGDPPADAATLRDRMRRAGLSRREWKLLANWVDVPLLTCLVRAGLFKWRGADQLTCVLRFFHLADAMELSYRHEHAEEAIFLGFFARTRFPAIAERAVVTHRVKYTPFGQGLAQELAILDRRARACGSSAWMRDGVPWRTLVAESRGWLGARNIGLWEPPIRRFARNGFVARALRCAEELATEGEEMRHCVGNLTNECMYGYLVVFSIRGTRGDTRRATVSYEMGPESGVWTQSNLKAAENGTVDPEVRDFAAALEHRMNRDVG